MENISGEMKISSRGIKNISELKRSIEKTSSLKITDLLEVIFGGPVELDASDIHIEPGAEKTKIRAMKRKRKKIRETTIPGSISSSATSRTRK